MNISAPKYAELLERVRGDHCHRHVEAMFLYAAAPVLRGAKAASLITLRADCGQSWKARRNALLAATGLQTFEITNRQGSLLLIYDENALRTALEDARAAALLLNYGYPAETGLAAMLEHLQKRFEKSGFPHEIGLFLGYPPEDVWGFIVNEGKNYVCCRYWKVYHKAERARETFRLIDEAQDYAADVLMRSTPIHVAAKLLMA